MTALFPRTILILFLLLTSGVLIGQEEKSNSPCLTPEQLQKIQLPEVQIHKVLPSNDPVPHISFLGTIGQEIQFELLLPREWNGRFAMGGGGGFVGSIQNSAEFSLSHGFATAGTDTGHQGSGHRATWAKNNIERQLNFGYMAIHRTAVVAKEIIRQYYCSSPEYSYFLGCSRGGGQAMMEAQRFPEDFDGIVAGAPAFTWPALGTEFIQNSQAIYPRKLNEPILTRADLTLLEQLILEQCDTLDGLRDGIINDPRKCTINYTVFPTCDTPEDKDCFTQDQLDAIKTVYRGVVLNGREVYPGFPYGAEGQPGGWFPWIVGLPSDTALFERTGLQYRYGSEVFRYFVYHDSAWDYQSADFTNFFDESKFASSFLDATSTDYASFEARGGKMIIYHGWNDPALSAFSTIDHYEAALAKDSRLPDYLRLFLLPGVLHCAGGPGPHQTDWLVHIQNWVEKGKAPDEVIVSKKHGPDTLMSRPVYPYPYLSQYKGVGDPNQANSFHKTRSNPHDIKR